MEAQPQVLYAFWRYDLFPFVLGGEITTFHDDGRITAKGFGGYAGFKPIKVLPEGAGKALLAKLKILKDKYDSELLELNNRSRDELYRLIPEARTS